MEKLPTSPELISEHMLDLTQAISRMIQVIDMYQGYLGNNEPLKQQGWALQRRVEEFDRVNGSRNAG